MPNRRAFVPDVNPKTVQMDELGLYPWNRGNLGGVAGQQYSLCAIQGHCGIEHPTLPLTDTKSFLKFFELNFNV